MKYLFGPVPSRRLGVSLGVDLVPLKVCSLNCVYCEVGKTTNLSIKREEYVPIAEVLEELESYLVQKPELDFITFSGQGEPSLNSGLSQVIDYIKDNHPGYKVALLTNGTLFWDPRLRAEVMRADVILPSLDAVSDACFRKINRPHPQLDNRSIIDGLIELRKEFQGKIYLEVFLIPGLNDTQPELDLLKTEMLKIAPDLVQLNTLDRPGTEDWVNAITAERLNEIAAFLAPLPVEIVAKAISRNKIQSFKQDLSDQILETIKRRPSTDSDLCEILNLHKNELNKYLSSLLDAGKIESKQMQRGLFFFIRSQ